jgi:hypothetical protein
MFGVASEKDVEVKLRETKRDISTRGPVEVNPAHSICDVSQSVATFT